jgi:hypothetical protein
MTSKIHQTANAGNREHTILSARIHEYQKPLLVDRTPKPMITSGHQVLVRVAAAGLCHSDLHLINGEWRDVLPVSLPITPGHEVAGWIEEVGNSVPQGIELLVVLLVIQSVQNDQQQGDYGVDWLTQRLNLDYFRDGNPWFNVYLMFKSIGPNHIELLI